MNEEQNYLFPVIATAKLGRPLSVVKIFFFW